MHSSCKIWKKPIDNASFFVFSQHWTSDLAQISHLRPHPLSFFVDFQLNMLGDSININSFCCNPVVLKKIGKTSKNCFLRLNLHYWEVSTRIFQIAKIRMLTFLLLFIQVANSAKVTKIWRFQNVNQVVLLNYYLN